MPLETLQCLSECQQIQDQLVASLLHAHVCKEAEGQGLQQQAGPKSGEEGTEETPLAVVRCL